MTKIKLALIGYPLGHSLSPILYECAFKQLGIEGSYELLPTKGEDLISRIKYLRANKYTGFNVTIPHKVPLTLFLSKYDENINAIGAVNTVKIEEDLSLSGYNTDLDGFIEPLKKYDLKGKKASIIGTGGASRAVCAGLYKSGVTKIDFYTRNVINSKETIDTLRQKFDTVEINSIQLSLLETLEDSDIVVNTTPVGMKNFDENSSPLEDKHIETLKNDAIIYDIVYNPLRTALISKAIKYNKTFITGLDMLVWQACYACRIFTGQMCDFKTLKIRALEEFLLYN